MGALRTTKHHDQLSALRSAVLKCWAPAPSARMRATGARFPRRARRLCDSDRARDFAMTRRRHFCAGGGRRVPSARHQPTGSRPDARRPAGQHRLAGRRPDVPQLASWPPRRRAGDGRHDLLAQRGQAVHARVEPEAPHRLHCAGAARRRLPVHDGLSVVVAGHRRRAPRRPGGRRTRGSVGERRNDGRCHAAAARGRRVAVFARRPRDSRVRREGRERVPRHHDRRVGLAEPRNNLRRRHRRADVQRGRRA